MHITLNRSIASPRKVLPDYATPWCRSGFAAVRNLGLVISVMPTSRAPQVVLVSCLRDSLTNSGAIYAALLLLPNGLGAPKRP